MIAQSIDALNEYQLDGRSVSQQKMEQWAAQQITFLFDTDTASQRINSLSQIRSPFKRT